MWSNKIISKLMLCLMAVSFVLCGCKDNNNKSNKTTENDKKEIESKSENVIEEIFINAGNFDCTFYNDESGIRVIWFDVISTTKMDESKLEIKIPIDNKYKVILEENLDDEDGLPYYVFQCYKGEDWELMRNLHETDMDKYYDRANKYEEEYKSAEHKELYAYKVAIQFPVPVNNEKFFEEEFRQITLMYDNKSYIVNIGNIKFVNTLNETFTEEGVALKSYGVSDYNVVQNSEGDITYKAFGMETSEDVRLKNIRVSNSNIRVESAIVDMVDKYGQAVNCQFKSDLKVESGSTINMIVKLKDENLKDKFVYSSNFFLILDYEVDGKEYSVFQEVLIRTKNNSSEIYAYYKDGIDILSYYTDFYYYITQ